MPWSCHCYPDESQIAAYNNPDNIALSLRLTRESTVLLKNNGILPLSKNTQKIAVIGPRADSVRMQFGGYTVPAGIEMSMGSLLKGMGIDLGGEVDTVYPGSNTKVQSPMLDQMLAKMMPIKIPTILEAICDKSNGEFLFAHGCPF